MKLVKDLEASGYLSFLAPAFAPNEDGDMSAHFRQDRNRALLSLFAASVVMVAYGIYWCMH